MTEKEIRDIAREEFIRMLNGEYELLVDPRSGAYTIMETEQAKTAQKNYKELGKRYMRITIGDHIGVLAAKHISERLK